MIPSTGSGLGFGGHGMHNAVIFGTRQEKPFKVRFTIVIIFIDS